MGELESVLDRKWRAACKVVLGQEVGPLADYWEWLGTHVEQPAYRKSSISGKKVAYAAGDYADGSRWVGLDEISFEKKFEPLSINEIKDIDNLLAALSERAAYAGSIVLGNSSHVEESANVNDSHYMRQCAVLGDSKYLARCFWGRLSESCFGCHGPGESEFMISCGESYRTKRCLEAWSCHNSSDIYYSHNVENCSDCLFCFNLKNSRHAIGNLALAPEKYAQLKKKLLEEFAEELKAKKRLPSLLDITAKCKTAAGFEKGKAGAENYGTSLQAVEKEFAKTSALLLGRQLSQIETYSEWLCRHTRKMEEVESAMSGKALSVVPSVTFSICPLQKGRILDIGEAWAHGALARISEQETEKLTLHNAHELIGGIAYFVIDFREGTNINTEKCDICIDSANAYKSCSIVYSKYVSHTFWTRNSNDVFGCDTLFDSNFCINCYRSQKLSRCFEMDACRGCSDCYFCHNCENLRDSMFCFNAKNLSYAIGNAPLPSENYKSVKKMLLEQMAEELEKKKDLKLDIFNVGAMKK